MRKNKIAIIIAILSISFCSTSLMATTPALASIGKAFPWVSGETLILISTLPTLIIMPFSILAGKIAGTKVKFRALAIAGSSIIMIFGLMPYFLDDFYAILITRGIAGIGAGLVAPLSATLIMELFDGNTRENLMGMNNLAFNAGGMVFQMLAGILCAIYWKNTFIVYLLCFIALIIIILMLPEPQRAQQEAGAQTIPKSKLSGTVYMWIAVYVLFVFFTYPLYLNMSSFVEQGNIGTAAVTGFILMMSTIGGMIGSAVFGAVFRFAKKRTVSIGFLLSSASYIIMLFGNSAFSFSAASMINGLGLGLMAPAVFMYVGLEVAASSRAFAMSLLMALPNLAMFLTSYFFAFIRTAFNITYPKYIFVIGLFFYMLGAVYFWFVKVKAKEAVIEEKEAM